LLWRKTPAGGRRGWLLWGGGGGVISAIPAMDFVTAIVRRGDDDVGHANAHEPGGGDDHHAVVDGALCNPLVASPSPLSNTADGVRRLADRPAAPWSWRRSPSGPRRYRSRAPGSSIAGPGPAVCGNRLVLDQASLRSVGVFSNRMLLRVIACELLFTAALGYLPQANRLRSGPIADRHAGAHGTIPSGRMGCPRTAPCPTSPANRLNAHAPGHYVCRISRFPFDAGADRR